MTDTPKILAPRPIKASSNIHGLRLIGNFEKLSNLSFNSYTPKLEKNKMDIQSQNSKFIGRLSDIESSTDKRLENFKLSKKASLFEVYCEEEKSDTPLFENILRRDFGVLKNECEDTISKSEILSILRNGSLSTNFSGFDKNFYQSENLADFNPNLYQEQADILILDDLRTSMPPIRSQNPLCRNFDMEKNSLKYATNTLEEEILDEHNLSFCQIGTSYDQK